MITRHFTQVVFWTAVLLSLLSVALVFAADEAFLVLLGVSALFNIWSLFKSERDGFVKSNQIRRAHEPARHFNPAQVAVVVVLVMAQVGLGAYALLT